MNVTSNGLSNATAVAHPGHTLFRFQTTGGKKLKSAHLFFFSRVNGGFLGDDSARS